MSNTIRVIREYQLNVNDLMVVMNLNKILNLLDNLNVKPTRK